MSDYSILLRAHEALKRDYEARKARLRLEAIVSPAPQDRPAAETEPKADAH